MNHLETFKHHFSDYATKQLSGGRLEVRTRAIDAAMHEARQVIKRLELNLKVERPGSLSGYSAFQVSVV